MPQVLYFAKTSLLRSQVITSSVISE